MDNVQTVYNRLFYCIRELNKTCSLFFVCPGKDFSRNRSLDFIKTITTILGFQGKTLDKELIDIGKPATASAFVQQRAKILPEAFYCLFRSHVKTIPVRYKYEGYRLLAADGSDVNTPHNKASVFYHEGEVVRGVQLKGFNQLHLNMLYDVLNKTYVDASINENERAAAISMTNRYDGPKGIFMADRGYPSYNLVEYLNRNPLLDYLIRVPNTNTFKEVSELPMEELDKDITVRLSTKSQQFCNAYGYRKVVGRPKFVDDLKKTVTWDFEETAEITYRVVRFKISGNTWETIITSLDRFRFPVAKIKELYHLRWNIETSYREYKYDLGAINFHAKKDEFILQEIYARLIMYNYCAAIVMSVSIPHVKSRKGYSYKINFTNAVYLIMMSFRNTDNRPPPVTLETDIQSYIIPVRPGRKDERNLKPKSAIYFMYRVA
ncbi:IS4 family transposase [Butyrivibrio sp. INlla21]|uniref:IS4 family transposase n=1 Tax=Butyrivibrio sp. INlla21 TaxID=1520811 RepID=UPI0008ECB110|nr:IS4 family transposase [Butyrivibrio sp. INlla21]SFU73936.1 Transposase DDE domain-containing protein [Butyrivibrio sp. INlla21]